MFAKVVEAKLGKAGLPHWPVPALLPHHNSPGASVQTRVIPSHLRIYSLLVLHTTVVRGNSGVLLQEREKGRSSSN